MSARPFSLALYAAATAALEPLAPVILARRTKRGKEDPARVSERLGHASVKRPDGELVWLHGVSVGESLSLLPLVDRIRAERPGVSILVTTGTVTAAMLLAKRLPEGVIHQFAPVDGPRATARFLNHWRPSAAIFAESELWPNLILGAKARGAKLALVSARITEHTAKGWARRRGAARMLLGAFDLVLPQDAQSAERLAALGAAPGPILNLKLVGAPLPVDGNAVMALEAMLRERDVVLAASTHPAEERLIAEALPKGPLLIIAPRHPDRGAAVEADLRAMGRRTARRSAGEAITPDTEIYIADTLGEMGTFFEVSELTIMGGSFMRGIGGHNPLEPARANTPVISGPHVFNFAEIYDDMARAKAVMVVDASALPDAITQLLNTPAAGKQCKAASVYAASLAGAFDAGWAQIKPLLP